MPTVHGDPTPTAPSTTTDRTDLGTDTALDDQDPQQTADDREVPGAPSEEEGEPEQDHHDGNTASASTRGTSGGGGPSLVVDQVTRLATSTDRLPEIDFTFWVDGRVIHVLADPMDTDEEHEDSVRYEWIWGDGEVTVGGAFESHRFIEEIEQTIVTLVRLGPDAAPTHESAQWIDLTFYRYGSGSSALQTEHTQPNQVLSLDRGPSSTADRGTQTDIGALVEAAPLPPMAPLLGLLAVVHRMRRPRDPDVGAL